jgi:hypothetical protein
LTSELYNYSAKQKVFLIFFIIPIFYHSITGLVTILVLISGVTNKMCDWNTQDIVKILVKDETLLHARRRFVSSLNIQVVSIKEFEDKYNRGNDLHTFFCDVIEKWKSINGNKATISSLSNILRDNEFVALAGKFQ